MSICFLKGGKFLFSYKIFEDLCVKNEVTVYRVSKDTGVATATLSAWKTGKYIPKVDKLQKIADYFSVPITYFMESDSQQNKTA